MAGSEEPQAAPRRATGLDDVITALRSSAGFDLAPDATNHFDLLDHGLQTGALLRESAPDDVALQVAGLVHDIGHVLPPFRDDAHGESAANFLRPVMGDVVADLVRLHVAAKRYLVSTEPTYRAQLRWDSTASLELQGGVMTSAEIDAFEAESLAARAVALRRADEGGKIEGLTIGSLDSWQCSLEAIALAHSSQDS
jgi:predicted HD phosphohydrolase